MNSGVTRGVCKTTSENNPLRESVTWFELTVENRRDSPSLPLDPRYIATADGVGAESRRLG